MKTATIIKKINEAADLLLKGWCRGTSAVDKGGMPVPVMSKKAVAFCLFGALGRVIKDDYDKKDELINKVKEIVEWPVEWNDYTCKNGQQAAQLFRRVVKKVEAS